MVSSIQVEPQIVSDIREAQRTDPYVHELKIKARSGQSDDFSVSSDGCLRFRGRLVVTPEPNGTTRSGKHSELSRTESPPQDGWNGVRWHAAAAASDGGGGRRLRVDGRGEESITDSDCKNQDIMVSVQYGPFNSNIPIGSTTIGKSRVVRDPIAMHTSWRSNNDIACVTRNPCTRASDESSTTKHRLLHASGPHPTPPPDDPI
ncbi:hypothetical protein F511_02012 [Dorcoceras hygrometricum]|uniref:Uncharacterized protein n=1 Tax=Dorcoceras hygrometricum TaxID=472368 RepID=A0A2Z7A2S2_9LAMI|nr:hypothetical protein F511_02012 [Dorcoceras hygrometricum]